MNSFCVLQIVLLLVLVKESRSVLWPCITSNDCSKVPTATCSIFSYCQCPAGYVFSSDVTRCLKESAYGVACEEAVQCSHMLTGAKCEAGLCTCDTGYTYVKGRCRQLANLHESCTADLDCFFSYNREAVACKQNSCECADGFYERSANVCRRKAYKDEDCVIDADCVGDNLTCKKDKCTETEATSYKEIGIQTQNQGIDKTGVRFITRDDDTQYGDPCSGEGEECPGLLYSVCRQGLCHCLEGYYEVNKICKAELGEYVNSAPLCGAGVYRDNRCLCAYNQFYGYNMRSCIKSVLGIGTSCTASSQCSPYGAAYCATVAPKRCQCYEYSTYDENKEMCVPKKGLGEYCEKEENCSVPKTDCTPQNTCVCKPNHYDVKGICKPGKGGDCEVPEDCGFEEAVCTTVENGVNKCDCNKGQVYHNNTCLKGAEQFEDECHETEQCKPLLGDLGKCIANKCTCDKETTHFKNGKCNPKKDLHEKCVTSNECFVAENPERVECRNSVCQCQFGYTTDVEQQKCVRPKSRKNSSGRPSAFKVITLLLTTAATLITGSALKQAYYP